MIHSCWEVNYKRQELCEYLENQTEFQNLKGNKRNEMKVMKRNQRIKVSKRHGFKVKKRENGSKLKERVNG